MFKIQKNSKGFTFIELIIVTAIICILAAIPIQYYTRYVKRTKIQEVVHSMDAIKTAISVYYAETGTGLAATLSLTDIRTQLGVDVPTKYLKGMTVNSQLSDGTPSGGGVITATFCDAGSASPKKPIGSGVDGATLILYPTSDYKDWKWAPNPTSTLAPAYIPKN